MMFILSLQSHGQDLELVTHYLASHIEIMAFSLLQASLYNETIKEKIL